MDQTKIMWFIIFEDDNFQQIYYWGEEEMSHNMLMDIQETNEPNMTPEDTATVGRG